eukprot:m.85177 g.85177  ORF g.85177 m.85177 type:complete len:398 (-) comp12999_c0_seq1:1436-2629(-)
MASENKYFKISGSVNLDGDIMCVRFSSGGKRIACACSDGTVRVYTASEPYPLVACLRPKTDTKGNPHAATCVRFFQKSKEYENQLIATYTSGNAMRWHYSSNKCIATHKGLTSLLCLDIRSDNKEYIVSGESEDVEIIDTATNERKMILGSGGLRLTSVNIQAPRGHANRIFALLYHPKKENVIISAGWDRTIQLWDSTQKEPVQYISGVYVCGEALAADAERNILVSGSYRKEDSLQAWDLNTLAKIGNISENHEECWAYSCVFAKGKPNLIAMAGAKENEVRMIHMENKMILGRFCDSRALFSCDLNNDSSLMAVGGASKTLFFLGVNDYGSSAPLVSPSYKKAKADAPAEPLKWDSKPAPAVLPTHIKEMRQSPAEFSFEDPDSGSDTDDSEAN